MLKGRRRKTSHKFEQPPTQTCVSGSCAEEDPRKLEQRAEAIRLALGRDDPMREALSVVTAACNARDLGLKCRQEYRLINHLALKARLRAENIASMTKALNENALKATQAALAMQGFSSFEQASREKPEYRHIPELESLLRASSNDPTQDGRTAVSCRNSLLRGFNLSEMRRKLDGLTDSKVVKRVKKCNGDERPKSAPTVSSKPGFEGFPATSSLDSKEFLEEYFDVVQSIDPIWEDAYYDETGKMHIHTVYNSSYRERKQMRQFQMRLRQSFPEDEQEKLDDCEKPDDC